MNTMKLDSQDILEAKLSANMKDRGEVRGECKDDASVQPSKSGQKARR